jgi:hypothetical protein
MTALPLEAPVHRPPQPPAAYLSGWEDARAGKYLGQNPYDHEAEAWQWLQWRLGWQRAKAGRGRPC